MGFIKEVYSGNRAGLVVAFGRGETSANYFNGDSVEEAIKYFNIYLKNNEMYIKTEDEKAISNLGIKAEDAPEFRATVDAIIVTLTDDTKIKGWFSTNSFASSDSEERDLYIEDLYYDEGEQEWVEDAAAFAFVQDGEAVSESFIPPFDLEGV